MHVSLISLLKKPRCRLRSAVPPVVLLARAVVVVWFLDTTSTPIHRPW